MAKWMTRFIERCAVHKSLQNKKVGFLPTWSKYIVPALRNISAQLHFSSIRLSAKSTNSLLHHLFINYWCLRLILNTMMPRGNLRSNKGSLQSPFLKISLSCYFFLFFSSSGRWWYTWNLRSKRGSLCSFPHRYLYPAIFLFSSSSGRWWYTWNLRSNRGSLEAAFIRQFLRWFWQG